MDGQTDAGRSARAAAPHSGIKDVKDFSMALGLAYLGCRVSMATPIPVQGSKNVMHSLARMIGDHGGELLHFDHPAEAESLTDWFTAN